MLALCFEGIGLMGGGEGRRELTDPVVSPEIRKPIDEHHIPSPEILRQTPQPESRNANTDI